MMNATNSLPANVFSTVNQATQIPGMAPLIPHQLYQTAQTPAPMVASQNYSYPLNATNTLAGPPVDTFNSSFTTNTLPAPFIAPKTATTTTNNAAVGGNSQLQLDLNALLNPTTPAVQPVPPVVANPFANSQATTIPAYAGQPGQQLNVMG